MSCPDATAPIDINISKSSGKCDLKCEYSYNYYNSSCIAKNRGDYISLSYDSSSSPPVLFNSMTYNVTEIRIYTPSLHSYSNQKADGEIIIVHNSNVAPKPLLVCIPFKKNDATSPTALILAKIINTVAKNAPADGESTTVDAPHYNLNMFIPNKPFFTYTATEPYQPCSETNDFIVFTLGDTTVNILEKSLAQLQTIIVNNSYDIKSGVHFFYNPKGPKKGSITGDEIYIDCQPVGQSDEEELLDRNNGSDDNSDSDSGSTTDYIIKNPIVRTILAALVFVFLIFVVNIVIGSIKMPSLSLSGGGRKKMVGGNAYDGFNYPFKWDNYPFSW
jgi:carbonic anhydrase